MEGNIIDQICKDCEKIIPATELIERAKHAFCNNYCKNPVLYPLEGSGLDEDDWLEKYCSNCPLDVL